MTSGLYRETWAEVALGAIRHNAALARGFLRDGCRLMAVVKAGGYGYGADESGQGVSARDFR